MDGGSGGTDGGGSNGQGSGGNGGGQQQSSVAEKVLTAISVAFTVALFAYVIWQATFVPNGGVPRATVVGTETLSDGSVRVNVRFANPGDVGLVTATVEANCTRPPPEVQFENVPADGRREGTVVCPAGTTAPNVSVSSWVEA